MLLCDSIRSKSALKDVDGRDKPGDDSETDGLISITSKSSGTDNIHEVAVMTWGIPTDTFVQIHVLLSLVGIASGLIVLYGLLTAQRLAGWTALFFATTILTSVTGFPLPPFGFDPARAVAVISLILLAAATAALYVFNLRGAWRWIYVCGAMAALYLNIFVAVVQSFQKLPFLRPLAPTQSEPPFAITQLAVLVAFVVLGVLAVIRFHPEAGTGRQRRLDSI